MPSTNIPPKPKGSSRQINRKAIRYAQQDFKDEVQIAAQEAASKALESFRDRELNQFQQAGSSSGSHKGNNESQPIQDLCEMSGVSVSYMPSTESAIRRGSSRGCNEQNERSGCFGEETPLAMLDLTRITEDERDNDNIYSRTKKKRKIFTFRKRKKKSGSYGSISSKSSRSSSIVKYFGRNRSISSESWKKTDFSRDAWMCGCCGKAFSNIKAAEVHEDRCIYESIAHLKWSEGDVGWVTTPTASVPQGLPNVKTTPTVTTAGDFDDLPLDETDEDDMFVSARSGNWEALEKQSSITFVDNAVVKLPQNGKTLKPILRQPSNSLYAQRVDSVPQQTPMPTLVEDHPFFKPESMEDLLLGQAMKQFIVLTDEALVNTALRAQSHIMTKEENDAEKELSYLANDKAYYEMLERRLTKRSSKSKSRTEKKGVLAKVQNKLADAYTIIKEGDSQGTFKDQYSQRDMNNKDTRTNIQHDNRTLYVNVIVKNSISVVNNELERLAKARWEATAASSKEQMSFEKFRGFARTNIVKLAGMALASDFTPGRIAVQLSNDLYRLMAPRMKRRGITIETEIEYRVGPFFVLATNVKKIDWVKLIKFTHSDLAVRTKIWRENRIRNEKSVSDECEPSVTDDIFSYVEEKGMEMEIEVREASAEAAFMLSALRELRADDRSKKQKEEENKAGDKGTIVGPLLGPAIKADKGPAQPPPGFEPPENLEFVGLEIDLPVGFKRLRWALMCSEAKFIHDALWKEEAKFLNIDITEWSHHDDGIGLAEIKGDAKEEDFLGAIQKCEYLMPKSAFVKANTCYETSKIEVYNEHCVCIKKFAQNPDVPYGSTFLAWTQVVLINTGNDTCRMICSVEAEFPNGPPLVSRQINSGMRAGVADSFVLLGETICKYADEYP